MFTSYLFFLKILFLLTAVLILLSNIDDAFVDVYYIIYKIRRKFFIYRKYRPFQAKDILAKEEQYFAILIPAWQESSVIAAMLKNTLSSYNYRNYHIFVGCYPNDPDTISEIEKIQPQYTNLHISLLPNPGPTSKADCLNQIYADIRHFENNSPFEFTGYILHDAEDIVHPLELKLYNHLIPRKDMVQIPVIPLERPWYDLTGGHYQDEFAENHIKEMVVRESLTGHVPSAGVGTAISRRAMSLISNNHSELPFDTGNLTEDYDLALRLKKGNLRLIFARFYAGPQDIIATREFFPNTVDAVVRQKSRWLMGIAFQGWRNQKWHGPLPLKYALFRDRKSISTALLSIAAYFVMLNILLVWFVEWLIPEGYHYPPLVRSGEALEYILWANLFFLSSRILHRFYFTYQIYGFLTGLMSLPRQLWGNVLNFMACIRAIYLYSEHLLFDKPLVWDKTDHMFPDMEPLSPYQGSPVASDIKKQKALYEQQS
ncbi:MAG: phage adsorption protein NrfB [Emcibacter sp.]|nr:phage adsorption protein NrfB [Emcibacter sp.]